MERGAIKSGNYVKSSVLVTSQKILVCLRPCYSCVGPSDCLNSINKHCKSGEARYTLKREERSLENMLYKFLIRYLLSTPFDNL